MPGAAPAGSHRDPVWSGDHDPGDRGGGWVGHGSYWPWATDRGEPRPPVSMPHLRAETLDYPGPLDGVARMAENRGRTPALQEALQHHGGCYGCVQKDVRGGEDMTKCKHQSITGKGCLRPGSPTGECWVYLEHSVARPFDECTYFERR